MDDTIRHATTADLLGQDGRRSTLPAVPVGEELPARSQTRCWIAAIGATLAFAAAVLFFVDALAQDAPYRSRRDAPVGVYVAALAFVVGLELTMYAYRQGRIARVLRGASWQRSPHAVATTGSGKKAQTRLHLIAVDRWLRHTYYLGSSAKLKRAEEVEWAGDLDGHVVVRLPESKRLALYHGVKE